MESILTYLGATLIVVSSIYLTMKIKRRVKLRRALKKNKWTLIFVWLFTNKKMEK